MIPLDHECSDLSQQLLDFGIQRGRRSLVLPRQADQHVGPSFLLPVGNQVQLDAAAG